MRHRRPAFTAFLAGCSTSDLGAGKKVPTEPTIDIVKGSSTADLVAILGEPLRIEPYEGDPNVEIWIYDIRKSTTDMVAIDTEEIPYVDPLTGQERTIIEPVYKPQTTTRSQRVKVFVVAETVIGWRVDTDVNRAILD